MPDTRFQLASEKQTKGGGPYWPTLLSRILVALTELKLRGGKPRCSGPGMRSSLYKSVSSLAFISQTSAFV